MKKLLTLILLGFLCSVGNVWADDVTIADINFKASSWSGKTFTQGNTTKSDTINDIYFYSKASDKQFSLASNTSNGLTFPGSNMSSGNYYFCIPLTGINKKITVTLKHSYSSKSASFKYAFADGRTTYQPGNTNGSGGTQVTDAAASDTEVSFDINVTNTAGHLFIGRQSSSYDKLLGVTITTPAASGKADPELSVSPTSVSLAKDGTRQLSPSRSGDGAITYESSNTNVATVSSTGLITAVGNGQATITISSAETESYDAGTATVKVIVKGADPTVLQYAKFNNGLTNSPEGFVTLSGDVSYNSSYTGTYDGTNFTKGLKLQSSTVVNFSTTSAGQLVIVQSTNSNGTKNFKLDDVAFATNYDTNYSYEDEDNKVKIYICTLAAGNHTIKRVDADFGLLYAGVTSAPAQKYNVIYKANGSGEDDVEHEVSKVEANMFTYSGHIFEQWNTMSDGSGTNYAVGATVSNDITLYAQWTAGYEETITYVVKTKDESAATTPSTHITNLVNETNVGIGTVIDQSKTDRSGKYATSSTDGYGVKFTFDVATGFTFCPTSISMKLATVSTTDFTFIVKLTDSNGTTLTSNTLNSFSGDGVLTDITFPEYNTVFAAGTVTMLVTAVRKDDADGTYRIGKTITITGIVKEGVAVATKSGRNYGTMVTPAGKKLNFASVDGVTAYIATGLNGAGDAVVLNSVDIVPAETPIIVKTDTKGATVNVPVTTADASSIAGNALVAGDGSTAWNGTANTTYYYLASDQFHEATSGTLQSGKAYLAINTGDHAPSLIRIIEEEENATSIEDIKANDDIVKYIENGRLLIKKDGVIYDVMGRIIR